jgi:hypothetical protein
MKKPSRLMGTVPEVKVRSTDLLNAVSATLIDQGLEIISYTANRVEAVSSYMKSKGMKFLITSSSDGVSIDLSVHHPDFTWTLAERVSISAFQKDGDLNILGACLIYKPQIPHGNPFISDIFEDATSFTATMEQALLLPNTNAVYNAFMSLKDKHYDLKDFAVISRPGEPNEPPSAPTTPYITDSHCLLHIDGNGISTYGIGTLSGSDESVEGHIYDITNHRDVSQRLSFQRGPVKEVGVNGITSEALLHILVDRTAYLQTQYPCIENESALRHLHDALAQFETRTYRRMQRGVEGRGVA